MESSKTNNQNNSLFMNPDADINERVDDLISKMTIEEKASQMLHRSKAVPHLNISEYDWWSEALHGVARAGCATVFPQAIAMAATFDSDLIFRIAEAISSEARAKYNESLKRDYHLKYCGLTYWSPNINIFRDPRWGRGQETYGEDPFLSGTLGVAFVKGLQGDQKYMKIAACAKHFAVHSGPEALRHEFNAETSEKDLYETYLSAFKMLVDAGVESVMGAYNRTNGEVCCGSQKLLVDILRGEWGFKGHVVSDCWAVRNFHETHRVTDTAEESVSLAISKGCDLNCGCTYEKILSAYKQGLISESDLDRSLKRLMKTRFKLGMFDPDENNQFSQIDKSVIDCSKHRKIAFEAAQKSVVLLKNADSVLPLSKETKKVYVTGPDASSIDALIGNYYGVNSRMVTALEGITNSVQKYSVVEYRPGCLIDRKNTNPEDWAVDESEDSEAIIAVMGLDSRLEGEEGDAIASGEKGDRPEISLPESQMDFLRKLSGNPNPLIVIIMAGSPMDMREIHELADAVLYAWYPGEEGGNALGSLIFGEASPAGKLPITFVNSLEDIPPYDDYSMENRTYRYMKNEAMYPFGFGLNYSQIKLSNEKIAKIEDNKWQASVEIKNTGNYDIEETLQLYLSPVEPEFSTAFKSLKAFRKIKLKAGESRAADFIIDQSMLEFYNDSGRKVLPSKSFKIFLGNSSPSKRSKELGAKFAEIDLKI